MTLWREDDPEAVLDADVPLCLDEYWARGKLRFLIRRHHQSLVYESFHRWERERPGECGPFVINSHRKMGKSFFLDVYCWERCLRYPWTIARFLAPTYEQGRDYLFDIHRQLEAMCPPRYRPEWSGDTLRFRNPRWNEPGAVSILELVGMKNPDAARGPRADLIVCDEVREWLQLEYAVRDILIWQFIGSKRPLLVISTTPPASMAHPYVKKYIPEAQARGTYFDLPLDDCPERYFRLWYDEKPRRVVGNPAIEEKHREMVIEECGGVHTIAYQREGLCELVSDPEALIVPEFQAVQERVILERPLPQHFHAYMAIDFGWHDYNGAVWAVLDFLQQRLHIVAELWMHNSSTGQLAAGMKLIEERVFGITEAQAEQGIRPGSHDEHGRPWRYRNLTRVGDHSKQQLTDLWFDWDVAVLEADKWDFEAALSNLRSTIAAQKLTIDPSCIHTIEQLAHGTWKVSEDGARRTFTRNNVLGHCDIIAALNYLHRKVDWTLNPAPLSKHRPSEQFCDPEDDETEGRIITVPLNPRWTPLQ